MAESMAKAVELERKYLERRKGDLLREASEIQARLDSWTTEMQPTNP